MSFDGKRVLVIGGTGSLGRALVRRMLSGAAGVPAKVVVMSRDEAKQHAMRLEYLHQRVTTDEVIYENFEQALEFRIGDVRSYADVTGAVRDADVVVNAAALKQVPTCEYFPEQALLTNCEGPANIVRAIREHDFPVETVVGVSTDKACKPVNVMGMTKAIQERIFVAANVLTTGTRFVVVRYGNVLASRGSVIPLFQEQIRNGGPVTVTAKEMTRFLTTMDRAVDTVVTAVRDGLPGDVFVPVCPAAAVVDVARALIGDRSVEMTITGTRPGEKVDEVLVSEEEINHAHRSPDGEYVVIAPMLPELARERDGGPTLDGEYSSGDLLMGEAEIAALLREQGLMVDQDGHAGEDVLA